MGRNKKERKNGRKYEKEVCCVFVLYSNICRVFAKFVIIIDEPEEM
jgi:hypothetical protein